jgi:hypothetical protein
MFKLFIFTKLKFVFVLYVHGNQFDESVAVGLTKAE